MGALFDNYSAQLNAQKSAMQTAMPIRDAGPAFNLATRAILFEGEKRHTLRDIELIAPKENDLVVDIEWSGISTGTERLMWSGEMPPFPGMGYPLVPGYEAVGRVVAAQSHQELLGKRVFVPGARCFKGAHGLFGASAARVVIAAEKAAPIGDELGEEAILLALAATAHHALSVGAPPDLIIGHGALGRLLARVAIAMGASPPVVWEIDPERADADGYAVIDPDCDGRSDYRAIYDVSGDSAIIDQLVASLAPGGEVTLAGFYKDRMSFTFAPAFMKEARLRISAEWKAQDLDAVLSYIEMGALSLDGIITHRCDANEAQSAYRTAFEDPSCLKMILDWRGMHD